MFLPRRFHWSVGLALAIVIGLAALLPFLLSGVEVFHSKVDGGGLAASLGAEETLIFLRTSSPKIAQGFLTVLKTDRELPELAESNHYEMGLQKQSDANVWVLATVDGFGQMTSVMTPTVTTTTLSAAERPLSRDPQFRRLAQPNKEVFFARPHVFSSFPLFYSLLTPAPNLTLTWDSAGTMGTLTLANAQFRLPSLPELPPIPVSDAPLLYKATLVPYVWFAESGRALKKIDPAEADGITGIGLAMLKKYTGSTDLQSFLSMIRAVSVQLTKEEGDTTPFITGSVRSSADLQTWLAAVRSEQVTGAVRTIDLLGENTRTDITVAESDQYEVLTGWELTPMTGERDFLLVTKERQFMMGLSTLVRDQIQAGGSSTVTQGSINLLWAKNILDLPSDVLPAFLGSEDGQLMWTVEQKGGDRVFTWSLQ